MSETPDARESRASSGEVPRISVLGAIRGSALGLLIGGGICLYFGLVLVADAPGSVSEDEAERWYAVDNAIFWGLRAIGVGFLICAGLAALALRFSMLAAVVVEVAFTLLMLAMAIEWTIEARVDGQWSYEVILLVILAALAIGGAKRSWELYRLSSLGHPAA